ncbi:MAG: hypothetical protein KatS3mg057_0836 [Herpetosiphonaceae bacterium]|nr:MAG: hypothetical protein KatS3mg057_0836 [Herpetosiphonaceae bacterium]
MTMRWCAGLISMPRAVSRKTIRESGFQVRSVETILELAGKVFAVINVMLGSVRWAGALCRLARYHQHDDHGDL